MFLSTYNYNQTMQVLDQDIDKDMVLNILGNKNIRPIIIQLMQRNITAREMIGTYNLPATSVYRSLHMLVRSGMVKQFKKRINDHRETKIINCYKLKFNNIIVRFGNAGLIINFE